MASESSNSSSPPNSGFQLTKEDQERVQSTWSLVTSDIRTNAVQFFLRFFKDYPEFQKYFKSFAKVPFDELPNNKRLAAHGLSVFYAISAVVENIDDIETAREQIVKIGANHYKRKITPDMFKIVGIVLVDFLTEKLGSEIMTKDVQESWGKVYSWIVDGASEGLRQEAEEAK